MTEELFREDADLPQCEARVVAVEPDGVRLDRTVFYPQGGGQAGDSGVLRLADGRELRIATRARASCMPGEIVHVPAPGSRCAPGIGALLTAPHRLARRSATCAFTPRRTCCARWCRTRWTAARSRADYARLDFHMAEPLDKADADAPASRASWPKRIRCSTAGSARTNSTPTRSWCAA